MSRGSTSRSKISTSAFPGPASGPSAMPRPRAAAPTFSGSSRSFAAMTPPAWRSTASRTLSRSKGRPKSTRCPLPPDDRTVAVPSPGLARRPLPADPLRGQGSGLDRRNSAATVLAPAHDLAGKGAEQHFGQVHQIPVVGVCLIELEHRELGVVRVESPSLRKLRLISNTRSKPPTTRRFRYSSGATRR